MFKLLLRPSLDESGFMIMGRRPPRPRVPGRPGIVPLVQEPHMYVVKVRIGPPPEHGPVIIVPGGAIPGDRMAEFARSLVAGFIKVGAYPFTVLRTDYVSLCVAWVTPATIKEVGAVIVQVVDQLGWQILGEIRVGNASEDM